MKHTYSYVMFGEILEALKEQGVNVSRSTLRRLESKGVFATRRTAGKWRVIPPTEKAAVIQAIKENYALAEPLV